MFNIFIVKAVLTNVKSAIYLYIVYLGTTYYNKQI